MLTRNGVKTSNQKPRFHGHYKVLSKMMDNWSHKTLSLRGLKRLTSEIKCEKDLIMRNAIERACSFFEKKRNLNWNAH